MKAKQILLILATGLLFSCGAKLKSSYDCECKDMWSNIKGNEFKDFEAAWGHYIDKDENFSENKVGYLYNVNYKCEGTSKCGQIWIWFDAYRQEGSSELASMGKVTHAYCFSPNSENPRLVNE